MNQRGFTMIELIMVLLVFTIMAGVAVPHMSNFSDERDLDNAANELVADLRWIQQLSINASVATDDDKIRLIPNMNFNYGSPSGYWITVSSNSLKTILFPKSINISSSNTITVFYFGLDGRLLIPQTITLSSGEKIRYVIIDTVGRIRVTNAI